MSLPLLTCSPSAWPSRLLYRRGRKSRSDLWITEKIQRKFSCLFYLHNIFLFSHLYEKTQQKQGKRLTVTVTLITSYYSSNFFPIVNTRTAKSTNCTELGSSWKAVGRSPSQLNKKSTARLFLFLCKKWDSYFEASCSSITCAWFKVTARCQENKLILSLSWIECLYETDVWLTYRHATVISNMRYAKLCHYRAEIFFKSQLIFCNSNTRGVRFGVLMAVSFSIINCWSVSSCNEWWSTLPTVRRNRLSTYIFNVVLKCDVVKTGGFGRSWYSEHEGSKSLNGVTFQKKIIFIFIVVRISYLQGRSSNTNVDRISFFNFYIFRTVRRAIYRVIH